MDWKRRLKNDERALRLLVYALGQTQAHRGPEEIARARRALGEKLAQVSAFVEECLSGRSDDEKSVLRYKLRVEYPLYAHLASLSGMAPEYVEWSHAEPPLPIYTVGAGRPS